MSIKIKLIIPFIAILLYSCNQKPFDKEIWNSKNIDDQITFENRNDMLDDLISNQHLIGKKISDVKELLGNPDENPDGNKNEKILEYTVLIKWDMIDPSSIKILNLRYNSRDKIDSIFITKNKY